LLQSFDVPQLPLVPQLEQPLQLLLQLSQLLQRYSKSSSIAPAGGLISTITSESKADSLLAASKGNAHFSLARSKSTACSPPLGNSWNGRPSKASFLCCEVDSF